MKMDNPAVKFKEENYIFFSIGTHNYAFGTRYILDIIQLVELEYPESMPDYIVGLLEYNNQIIKIVDLRNILDIETGEYGLNSKIVVIKTQNDIFGIIIDEVEKIYRILGASFNKPPYDASKSFIEAIYTEKEFSATVINIENIEKKINSNNGIAGGGKSSSALLPKDVTSREILHRRRLHYAVKSREGTNLIIKSRDTYITFLLDKNICCIKILHVAGFYKYQNVKLTKVPCTPDFVAGVASIKGRYITVIDLLQFAENRKTPVSKDTSIIVIEYEDYELGIVADAIGETVDIEENLVKMKADNPKNKCLTECVMYGNMYLFLDVKKLFGDEKLYIS